MRGLRRTTAALVAAAAGTAGLALPAQAEEPPLTITVTGCQEVTQVSRATSKVPQDATRIFDGDGFRSHVLSTGTGRIGLPAGTYTWRFMVGKYPYTPYSHGRVTVQPCKGDASWRQGDGDADWPGKPSPADVVTISGDGSMYLYRMTSKGLANGVKVGHGWQGVDWATRMVEPGCLLVRRTDGSLWLYETTTGAHYLNPRKLGTGFQGYEDLHLVPTSSAVTTGSWTLVGRKNGMVHAWDLTSGHDVEVGVRVVVGRAAAGARQDIALRDFDGDGWADDMVIGTNGRMVATMTTWDRHTTTRVVGSGWAASSLVRSVGDMTGDGLPDLLVRKADGTLLMYPNTTTRGQHGWGRAVVLGHGWGGMKLVF